jgi:rieske iron-sulfur protein
MAGGGFFPGPMDITVKCAYGHPRENEPLMSQAEKFRGTLSRRRTVIGAGLGLAPWLARTANAVTPDAMHPQLGDRFVFLTGPKQGQVVKLDDLPVGGPQEQAYPVDPASGVVRNGTPFNLVLLARFDPAVLAAGTLARAADGVVAYSAVCTHQGCPVNMWSSEKNDFVCSCHGSTYDPRDGAKVVWGPAPRPLPSLGLKVQDGFPVVATGFSSRVGPEQA